MSNAWLKDKAVSENWLSQLGSERTVSNYRSDFPKWLRHINMTPSEQIQKRIKDLQSTDMKERRFFERELTALKHKLEPNYRESSVRSVIRTVQSFFKYNGMPLVLTSVDSKIKSTKQDTVIKLPSNEEIRAIYSHASKYLRCAMLLSYQSGFDGNDICTMQIQDFPQLTEGEHLFVIYKRNKTSVPTYTCFSVELLHDLKVCMTERGNPTHGYLVTSVHDKPFTSSTLNQLFSRLSEKVLGKKYVFKTLRKCYKREMNKAKIQDSEVKKTLIGHSIGVEANYSLWKSNPEPIIEAYNKMFPLLSINGARRSKEDITELKKKYEELKHAMALIYASAKEEGLAKLSFQNMTEIEKALGLTSEEKAKEESEESEHA